MSKVVHESAFFSSAIPRGADSRRGPDAQYALVNLIRLERIAGQYNAAHSPSNIIWRRRSTLSVRVVMHCIQTR